MPEFTTIPPAEMIKKSTPRANQTRAQRAAMAFFDQAVAEATGQAGHFVLSADENLRAVIMRIHRAAMRAGLKAKVVHEGNVVEFTVK